jgi:hypothetical protein
MRLGECGGHVWAPAAEEPYRSKRLPARAYARYGKYKCCLTRDSDVDTMRAVSSTIDITSV